MTILQAIILGLVQGLTEFLPVSSSGHLVLFQNYFAFKEPPLFFDCLLHVATLLVVVYFFRKIILETGRNGAYGLMNAAHQRPIRAAELASINYVFMILISTVVTGTLALTFEDQLEAMFAQVDKVGVAFIVTSIILFLPKLRKSEGITRINQLNWKHAVVLGLAQALAVTPGISRSGTTISIALLLGFSRSLAIEYSFLIAIPAILGATLLQFLKTPELAGAGPAIWGFIFAALSGFLALKLLALITRKGNLYYFSFYCFPLGVIVLLVTW